MIPEGFVRQPAKIPIRPPKPSGKSVDPSVGRDLKTDPLPGVGVELDTPAQILTAGSKIQAALAAHPELTSLLFVNPALVLKDLGFTLTAEATHHVLDTLAQGSAIRGEMQALEQEIRAALTDDQAKWNLLNPTHTASIVFEQLGLTPLHTEGVAVPYLDGPRSQRFAALQARAGRPTRRVAAAKHTRRSPHGLKIGMPIYRAAVRRLDLDAVLPVLARADRAPRTLATQELLFYRDAHPLVRKLVRYQVLNAKRLAWHTGGTYRAIRDGKQGSIWRGWIGSVRHAEPTPAAAPTEPTTRKARASARKGK